MLAKAQNHTNGHVWWNRIVKVWFGKPKITDHATEGPTPVLSSLPQSPSNALPHDWLIWGTDIVGHQTQWASMVIGPALTSAFTSMCRRLLQYLCILNGSQLKTTNLGNTERYGTCKAQNHTNGHVWWITNSRLRSRVSHNLVHHPNTSLSIDTDS